MLRSYLLAKGVHDARAEVQRLATEGDEVVQELAGHSVSPIVWVVSVIRGRMGFID